MQGISYLKKKNLKCQTYFVAQDDLVLSIDLTRPSLGSYKSFL